MFLPSLQHRLPMKYQTRCWTQGIQRRGEKKSQGVTPALGGGGLLRGLLLWREGKPSLRNPTKSCGVTSMVHRRGLGTVRNWKAF